MSSETAEIKDAPAPAETPKATEAPKPAATAEGRPKRQPVGPPPTFVETILADIEWSGGHVDVPDDTDPDGWRGRKLELKSLVHAAQQLGFYATVLHRVSRWCKVRGMTFLSAPIQFLNHSLTGAEISHHADIGPGLRIGHPQGVFIGPGVKVGIRSTFNQGTALSSNMEMDEGSPEVGNYLYMSPGAKAFGKLKLGDRVWIGPNSVALKDVEDDKVVLGVPGRAMPSTFRRQSPT